jgi:hypothetical protein
MRLYRRDEFLNLPAGILYVKAGTIRNGAQEWGFEGPEVKGDTVAGADWYSRPLSKIETGDDDMFECLDKMIETGITYPLADFVVRDGLFDAGDLFLVFERDDLVTLRGLIDAAMEVS